MPVTKRLARPGVWEILFPIVREGVDVVVTLEVFEERDVLVCGLRFLEGKIKLSRRDLIAVALDALTQIEQLARDAGCAEIRHCGETAKALFLPNYEPMSALQNGRRKVLK